MDLDAKLAAFEARSKSDSAFSAAAPVILQTRRDMYVNTVSGFGGSRDPLSRTGFYAEPVPGQAELELLYRFNWLARRIVDLLPADACREGVEIAIEDADMGADLYRRMDELLVWERIEEALRMARLYGGSILLLGAVDGRNTDPVQPLVVDKVEQMASLTVLDRWQLSVARSFDDPLAPSFGQPEIYRINPATGTPATGASMVHASRVIRFDGAWLPDRAKQQNQGWHDSVITAVNQNLKQFGISSLQGRGPCSFRILSPRCLKIPNLAQMISDGNEDVSSWARIQYAASAT